jgi:tRNA threonylcarbamoyladenosine biosynthesis protein TsaE
VRRFLADESATIAFGNEIFAALPIELSGWTILLIGELGAGKSTFARAVIKAAGHEGRVPSPTYTLVERYNLASANIYHVDLYRVSEEEELRYLGWSELDDGLRLVEWPERVPGLLQDSDLALQLDYDGDSRNADIQGLSERGKMLIQRLGQSSQ